MIKIQIDSSKFRKTSMTFRARLRNHPDIMKKTLLEVAKYAVGTARMNVAGRILNVRTGKLFKSIDIHGPVTVTRRSMSVKVGSRMSGPINYGKVWEYGIPKITPSHN